MFSYVKKLQYPVNIKHCDPAAASIIISQYGGPDGELGASLRYLSQRYSMPIPELKGLLTDIGVEELGHLEMIGTIVHQLTRNLTEKQIEESGFAPYFVEYGFYCENHQGKLKPVPSNPETFAPDIGALEQAIDEKSRVFVDTDMYSLIDRVWNGSQCRGRNFTVGYGREYCVSKL